MLFRFKDLERDYLDFVSRVDSSRRVLCRKKQGQTDSLISPALLSRVFCYK